MDSNLRKTLENNLQIIKPMIDEIKSFPNDTNEMTPIIKYLKNIPPIHYTFNEDKMPKIKGRNEPIDTIAQPLLRNTMKNLYYDKERLTINNNTNLTNLNLYFLYNNETNKNQNTNMNQLHMSKSVKKKEPIDSSSKKNIIINNEASLNQTTKKLIKKDERVKSVYNKVKSVKKMNSNSPKNNTSYFALKKRDEKIKNKLEDKQINTVRDKISKTEKKLKVVINNMVTTINEEPKGDLNLTEFTKINQIGKGTFGKIYAVKWKKNGKKYALKKETFNDQEFYEKRNEIKKIINSFLEKTQSNGVIKIYANLLRKNMDEYNYYELMEIGERDWDQEIIIRRKKEQYYTEPELFNIANQLIKTLSLMQKNHITHRDIKHQNILVVNGNYKLCDFGEIRSMKGNGVVVQRIRGSELFMSPILFYGLRANLIQVKHNTYKSDVFSLGMCLLYAATMHFDGTDEIRELIDMNKIKIILEKYLKERYSDKFINLLLKMLETKEDLRPDFEQLEKDFANL